METRRTDLPVTPAADAGPRQCAECGHAESKHFSCAIGSFCGVCSIDNHVWEHVFRPVPEVRRVRHSDGIGGECPGCEDCNPDWVMRVAVKIYEATEKVIITEEPLWFIRKTLMPEQIAAMICEEVHATHIAPPVPQEAAPHSKKCAEQLYSSMDAKCICGSDTRSAGPHQGIGGLGLPFPPMRLK